MRDDDQGITPAAGGDGAPGNRSAVQTARIGSDPAQSPTTGGRRPLWRRDWVLVMGGVCAAFTLACLYAAYSHHRKAQQRAELEARVEEMAPLLKSNTDDHRFQPTGLHPDRRFWVGETRSRWTTVRQALIDLDASLRDGKVVDPQGRELYFYRVIDHEGHEEGQPTEQETEALERQGFRVVRMYGPMPKD
jgi:hypothetical protein